MRSLLAFCVVLCTTFVIVSARVPAQERALSVQGELHRQRLIRIVEPAIYPLHRLAERGYGHPHYDEFWESCDHTSVTELGQAWISCRGQGSMAFEGPNPTDEVYGDKTISVTVLGFDTHENLCWLREDTH